MGLDITGYICRKAREKKDYETTVEYWNELLKNRRNSVKRKAKKLIEQYSIELKKAEDEKRLYPYLFHNASAELEKLLPFLFRADAIKEFKTFAEFNAWKDKLEWKDYYAPGELYFRKVNFIYRYFENQLEDETCIVTRDEIKTLIDTCLTVLYEKKTSTSKDLLSTRAGFFFGSTDYDEWYYKDVVEAISKLSEILNEMTDKDRLIITMSW